MRRPFYFSFGTSEEFPFRLGWVTVFAENRDEAVEKYRKKYPDRRDGTVNCSFIYDTVLFTGNPVLSFGGQEWDVIE